MSRIRSALLLAFVGAIALQPILARAEASCAEGKTVSGECVDAGLAAEARQAAIIFSQPKISYTAFPVLPNGDPAYRYPNQLIPDLQKPSAFGGGLWHPYNP